MINTNIKIPKIYFDKIQKFNVIKRDGRKEPFFIEKLLKVITWACETGTSVKSDVYIEELLKEISLEIIDGMTIENLYNRIIEISVSKISKLYTNWDIIAKNLYLLKIYKENFKLKRIGTYPSLSRFIRKGIKDKVYDPELFENNFTSEEIEEINLFINPNRDLLFNYKGLRLFFDKYCKTNYKKKKIELPQITYIIAAMHAHYNEPHNTKLEKKERLKNIEKMYNLLSKHQITLATPMIANSGMKNAQFASCVLITADDDTHSLNITDDWVAIYSKYMGGIGYDISRIRGSGSLISYSNGISDGPIPFIKRNEQTVSSFNQQGKRPGSIAIYFQWWHWDVFDLLMLKDAGGSEENRARKCKYSIKLNDLFLKRVINDEYVTLFDPKETQILNETYGEEFDELYMKFENNANIRSKRVKARDIMYQLIKVRSETGNVYIFFVENVNKQNVTNRFIGMSNLCSEIVVPSRPPQIKNETYFKNNKNKYIVKTTRENGEIGLCNLSSINSLEWFYLSDNKKDVLIETLLRSFDNRIESQFYPVPEAEWTNKAYRPIGIGITGFANLLAFNKLKFSDHAAFQFTNDLYDDIYYRIYKFSMILAKEKGYYDEFKSSNWAKGLTPYHLSTYRKNNFLNIKFKNDEKWNKLAEDISKNGVRFSLHSTLPPSACHLIDDKIITEKGEMSFKYFLKSYNILSREEFLTIMMDVNPKEIDIKDLNIKIPTRFGSKRVNSIHYNGFRFVNKLIFSDGNSYSFTHNHPLLLNDGKFVEISNLSVGDELYHENKCIKIIKIEKGEELLPTWGMEIDEVNEYYMGNGIISHNTSGKCINVTEACEPIMDIFYMESGIYTLPTIVKGKEEKVWSYYEKCWDIDTKVILNHAAIRQIYLDQSQSFTIYEKNQNSALKIFDDMVYANKMGIKTLYYMKSNKIDTDLDECESCSS